MKFLDSKLLTLFVFIVSILVGYQAYKSMSCFQDSRITATTLITFGTTLFGFVLTSLSIIVAISDRPFIKRIGETGHLGKLLNQLFCTAGLLLLVIVTGLAGHLAPRTTHAAIVGVTSSLVVMACFSFVRVGLKFKRVINIITGQVG